MTEEEKFTTDDEEREEQVGGPEEAAEEFGHEEFGDEEFGESVQEEPAGIETPEESAETEEMTQEEKTWGMVCHLAGLAGFVGIPAGNVLGPLIAWLIKKDEFPFVDIQGKEALNFQISMTIYGVVAFLLVFVVIGIPLLIAIGIADLVLLIIAGVKASKGESYRYPLTIRFIK